MRSALLVLAAFLSSCGGGDDGGTQQVPDTQPPDVDIVQPPAGPVSGSVEIRVAAFDNRGVVGVLTFIDGVQFGDEDSAAPYTSVWNTATTTNGGHVLTATARDAAGYVGTSPEVMVTVSGGT